MARSKVKVARKQALDVIKEIKKGDVHHLYVLEGSELYFHDIVIKHMIEWAKNGNIDTEVIYADEGEIPVNSGGGGMFSAGKLYIIKHWELNKKSQSKWEKFFIEGDDLYYVISITAPKIKYYIDTVKDRIDVSCEPLRGKKLKSFIKSAIKKRGKDITDTALDLLIDLSGGKINILTTELSKLELIEENIITEDTIAKYFSLHSTGDIFVFWDALWSGKTGVAGEMKRAILLAGDPPIKIIATIATFIRGVLEVGQLRSRGYSIKDIAKLTGKSGFYIGKLLSIYEMIGIDGAISILERLYALDKGIKTGEISDNDALDDILAYIISLRVKVE